MVYGGGYLLTPQCPINGPATASLRPYHDHVMAVLPCYHLVAAPATIPRYPDRGRRVAETAVSRSRWVTSTCKARSEGWRKRIMSFCGAKPPRKLRWTDAGRCRLVVGYGDFTQDAGWRGR